MNKKWLFNHHGGHQPLLLVLGQALLHVLAQLLVVVALLLQLADLRLVEGLAGKEPKGDLSKSGRKCFLSFQLQRFRRFLLSLFKQFRWKQKEKNEVFCG